MQFLQDKFSKDVRDERGENALRNVAAGLKVSAATISRIENGNLPDLLTYAKLCKWMGCSLNKYFDKPQNEKVAEILKQIVHDFAVTGPPNYGVALKNRLNKQIENL